MIFRWVLRWVLRCTLSAHLYLSAQQHVPPARDFDPSPWRSYYCRQLHRRTTRVQYFHPAYGYGRA